MLTRLNTPALGFLLVVFCIVTPAAIAQSVQLHWSEDGHRCWFGSVPQNGVRQFRVVDVEAGTCQTAFDHQRALEAVSRATGRQTSELSIDGIAFTDSKDRLVLRVGGKYWVLDIESMTVTDAALPDVRQSGKRLYLPKRRSAASGQSTQIEIENRLDGPLELFWVTAGGEERRYGTIPSDEVRRQHTYVGHVWMLKSESDEVLGCFSAAAYDHVLIDDHAVQTVQRRGRGRTNRPSARGAADNRGAVSPDGKWTAFVRDHRLWVRDADEEYQLSSTGSADNSFGRKGGQEPFVHWSPGSDYLVAFQTRETDPRAVFIVESSPPDQVQPKLHSYDYRKPGDELPIPVVHLYSTETLSEVAVSNELFENPWSLRFDRWAESGDRFYLHYNQRGHQTIRVLEVTVADGLVRPIIEETSDTFLHYSSPGKSVFEDLGGDEILWASERSGWNHLYRYSRSSGQLIGAVTSGQWNVKRIERIDRDASRIWFYAVGLFPDQDPYHEHFCCVRFDGSEFKVLTDGDGTHQCRFEQDEQYFVDEWSRVDMAPVTQLRDSDTGELICDLMREDTASRFGPRRLTERFVAKGRDGVTDIWGIIHWPRDFDSDARYPIVENIYAGPHDHHVSKSFRTRFNHQHRIADAGMIVVQIDGMGTAWRSKAFHDVCFKNLRDAGFPDRIAWIRAAAAKYPQMDLERVGIYGGSAGGQNAMAALLWHNDFYKVAVADCGCHDNRMDKIWWNEQWMGWPVDDSYARNSNVEHAQLLKGQLMLVVGELDRNVDPASTTQVVRELIKQDKDFEFVLVAGAGHGSAETPWASRQRLRFLKQHLQVP